MSKLNIIKNLLFLVIIVSLISCFGGSITFYVEDETQTTIESAFPINLPFNLPILPVTTTATQEYENNKTTPELVEEVILEKITITVTSPSNADFSALKSIHIYIKKSDDTEIKEIAYLTNINSEAKTIDLICTKENLVTYLREESYKLDIEAELKEILLYDVDIKIDLKFKITAKIL